MSTYCVLGTGHWIIISLCCQNGQEGVTPCFVQTRKQRLGYDELLAPDPMARKGVGIREVFGESQASQPLPLPWPCSPRGSCPHQLSWGGDGGGREAALPELRCGGVGRKRGFLQQALAGLWD